MFYCKECKTTVRKLAKGVICRKCGGEHFTSPQVQRLEENFNRLFTSGKLDKLFRLRKQK